MVCNSIARRAALVSRIGFSRTAAFLILLAPNLARKRAAEVDDLLVLDGEVFL